MSDTSLPHGCSDPECDLDLIPGRTTCLCGAPIQGLGTSASQEPHQPADMAEAPSAPEHDSFAGPPPTAAPPGGPPRGKQAAPDPFASAVDGPGESRVGPNNAATPPATRSPRALPSQGDQAATPAGSPARPNTARAVSGKKLRRQRSVVHVKPQNELSEVIEPEQRSKPAEVPASPAHDDERYVPGETEEMRTYKPEGVVSPVIDGDRSVDLRDQPVDGQLARRPHQVGVAPRNTGGATCRVCGRHKPRAGHYFCQCGEQVVFDHEVVEAEPVEPQSSWWRRVTGTSPSFGVDRRTMSQRRRDAGASLKFASRLERQTRMVLAGGAVAWLGVLGLSAGPFRGQVSEIPGLFTPSSAEEIEEIAGLPAELVDGSLTTAWQEPWAFGEVLPQSRFNQRDCVAPGEDAPEAPVHEPRGADQPLVLEAALPQTFDVVEVWVTIGPTIANSATGLAEPTRMVSQVRLTFLDADRAVIGCGLHELVSSPERQVIEVEADGTRFVEIVPTQVRSSVRIEAPFVQIQEIKIIED